MSEITLDRLVTVIRECAGDSDEFDLDGDILDVTFEELGYDSLALLEISARLQEEFGATVSETEMETPRITLRLLNEAVRSDADRTDADRTDSSEVAA
ncbi:acyl carrier protein [Streptomyces caatingaensis]|uniref:Carrier domain-containing protein n=1 Tax=Streptomyces caatingaensis TaxID=1678637 RepID=A0A0K9XJ72_9ACTN|nr:acyl carrier protein [Streptomyces caatingaensis]KNB53420.1 hypothetical protein AC230_01715 [Streptomyces caatingaensis]